MVFDLAAFMISIIINQFFAIINKNRSGVLGFWGASVLRGG